MAAILCKACYKPCEYCAKGCVKCCDGFQKCVSEVCSCLGECCDQTCDFIFKIFERPFSCCVFYVFLMNLIPLIIATIIISGDYSSDCDKPLHIFMFVSLVLFVINMFMGVYIFRKISMYEEYDDGNKSLHSQVVHVLLYDFVVFLYILVGIFMIIWSIMGMNWADQEKKCKTTHSDFVDFCRSAAVILQVYVWGTLVIVLFSTCSTISCISDCFGTEKGRQERRERARKKREERINRKIPVAQMAPAPHNQQQPQYAPQQQPQYAPQQQPQYAPQQQPQYAPQQQPQYAPQQQPQYAPQQQPSSYYSADVGNNNYPSASQQPPPYGPNQGLQYGAVAPAAGGPSVSYQQEAQPKEEDALQKVAKAGLDKAKKGIAKSINWLKGDKAQKK